MMTGGRENRLPRASEQGKGPGHHKGFQGLSVDHCALSR